MPVRRGLRYALIAVAAVIVIAGGAVAVMIARFDPNEYKGQIVQAVKQATGRDLALNGRIGLKTSLTPTLQLQDAALSNPPGFSRPQMVTLQRLELQLALLPLLSRHVEIERLVLIQPDILLETDAAGHNNWTFTPEKPAPSEPATPKDPAARQAATAPSIFIGAIAIRNGIVAMRDGKSGARQTIAVPAFDGGAKSPADPMHLTAAIVDNAVTFDVTADTGSLSALQNPAAPSWPFTVALGITGAALGDTTVKITGSAGSPAMLTSGKPAAYPIDLTIQSAGAMISAKGSIADANALSGAKIALSARIPDLAGLSPLAGRPLPAVKDVALTTTVTDTDGGLRNGVALHDIALTSSAADLAGDIAVRMVGKQSIRATLKSNRIDADALETAAENKPAAKPTAAVPAPPPKPANKRVFSDQKLPLDLLNATDADVTLAVADLRSGGVDYKAVTAHGVVKDGKLTVDPLSADVPGGHLAGTVLAEAQPPGVHVTLHAPGLALTSLLALAHQHAFASGNLEVLADLQGSGDSPHAIASTLDGYLGLAVANGQIDGTVIGGLFGDVLNTVNGIGLTGKKDGNALKCFAVRMDANHGIGTFKALALDSASLTMTGGGSVNLGAETLDMAVRPQVRAGGAGVLSVPLTINGPMTAPSVKVNAGKSAVDNAGSVAGAVLGNATPLGIVAGLAGADKALGLGSADICPPALAAARGQAVPAEASEPAPAQKKAPNPAELLKNLFR